jgi:NMD protein affecting ribosome stability and mRNA decay
MRVQSARNAVRSIIKGAGNGQQWQSIEELCPACRRIKDEFPTGVVTLRGDFARVHKDEMVSLALHQEAAEKKEHPFNRIINIEESVEGIVITTTDIHLPRRIGEAIQRAFHGQIDDIFDKGGYFVRVNWTRDA